MRRAVAVVAAVVAVLAAVGVARDGQPAVVAAGSPVVLADGDVVELGPGRHDSFAMDVAATVRGQPGAVVAGGIVIRADGAALEDVAVVGGETGVLVRDARDVVLDGVSVRGAELHGIEVVEGTAAIRRCQVSGLRSRYAQGVEIRNSAGLGHSLIEGCRVVGGQEGLVSHVSRVQVRDNEVTATTQRGITITEMSEGLVEANLVHDVAGSGIFCGDMSHCEVRANSINGVTGGRSGVRSEAGHGIGAMYYATLRESANMVSDLSGERVHLSVGSVVTDRFPLGIWPAGWRGALAVVPATAAWVALMLLAWLFGRKVAPRWSERAAAARPGSMMVLVSAALIQGFHQFEHSLQVWQVMVADAERRAGLLGSAVDTEWLHFAFNVALLVALVAGLHQARASLPPSAGTRAGQWLLAATAVQGYHLAEHVVKLAQHVTLGVNPAPGIVGHRFGLVAFHFAINTAVSVGLFIGVGIALRAKRQGRSPAAALTPA